ncbi:hypothetical protein KQ299_07125 [Synechococcus sp. CS-603]|nr:hypothetical protein [Synechococcus sp. CS-603]
MGLLDRLLGKGGDGGVFSSKPAKPKQEKAAKEEGSFFLDADSSGTLGNVNYMRTPNTIRHTFPGNVESPGNKEIIQQVDSMQARIESSNAETEVKSSVRPSQGYSDGVPKKVKKTFVERMSSAELDRRLRGSAVSGVNTPGGISPRPAGSAAAESSTSQQQGEKPGAIDPFKAMAKELNS